MSSTHTSQLDENDLPLRRRGTLGAVVVSIGLTLGALGQVWWRRKQERQRVLAAQPSPRLVPVELPQTIQAFEKLLDGVRTWVKLLPKWHDRAPAVLVWSEQWPRVQFPGQSQPGDDPSIAKAVDMVLRSLAVARAEAAVSDEQVVVRAEATERDPQTAASLRPSQTTSTSSSLSTLTRESPTPGYLDEVRDGDELLGDDGLAATAVRSAAVAAALGKCPRTGARRSRPAPAPPCTHRSVRAHGFAGTWPRFRDLPNTPVRWSNILKIPPGRDLPWT
jgi:hypothetical protein